MPSGAKEMVINTQERAISTDINRLQAFSGDARSEMFRWLLNVQQYADDYGWLPAPPFANAQNTTLTAPLSAEILGGLLVRPQQGASAFPLGLIIDPGVAFVVNPDTDPDASVYKFVSDPGIPTLGILNMTANASGSLRVDVIECSYNFNASAETDNRDIFNPATGLFAAVTVNKAQQATMTYRVRTGTPGGGFPGTASGWLPLCVAFVPAATTTNDAILFYDVRPLIGDRKRITNTPQINNRLATSNVHVDNLNGASAYLFGTCEMASPLIIPTPGVTVFSPYRVGGRFIANSTGSQNGPDLTQALYQSSAGLTNNAPAYLYLCTPFGLPRWAQYSPASDGTRVPLGWKGILVVSSIAPYGDGFPTSAIALPTPLGAASTSNASCFAAVLYQSTAFVNMANDGELLRTVCEGSARGWGALVSGTLSGTNNSFATFTITPGGAYSTAWHPPSATVLEVLVRIQVVVHTLQTMVIDGASLSVISHGGTYDRSDVFVESMTFYNPSGGDLTFNWGFKVRIPVPDRVRADATLATWQLGFNAPGAMANPTLGGMTAAALVITGFGLI